MGMRRNIIHILTISLLAASFSLLAKEGEPRLRGSFRNSAAKKMTGVKSVSPKAASAENRNSDFGSIVAPGKCEKPSEKFAWNFKNSKMIDIIEQVSRITCKSFILSSGVKANQEISIISRAPVSVEGAWTAFLSALEVNNLALVKAGDFEKIVKRNDAAKQAIPYHVDLKKLPRNESMVTFIYEVKNTSREAVRSLLKGMVSKEGELDLVGDGMVIITDSASNIRRIMGVLEEVDVVGASNRIHVIDLNHADALEVEKKLNEIFEPSGDKKRGTSAASRASLIRRGGPTEDENQKFSVYKIISDERTNKLLVIASDQAFEKIQEVIAMVDVPSSDNTNQGQVHVYRLKNSDASKIGQTLNSLTQNARSNDSRSSSRSRRHDRDKDDNDALLFEGEVRVTADEGSNSLVIVASPRDYKALQIVLEKLDTPRAQVYIEAVIMDIDVKNKAERGINAFGAIQAAGSTLISGNPGGTALATGVLTGLADPSKGFGLGSLLGTLGIMGPTFELNGNPIPSFGAVLNLLDTYSDFDILSTPSIMTIDNEKAEMSVGEKIPILKGTSAVQGMSIPLQNVTYEDVDLKFAVTPHIGDDDSLRIEIEQDVNEIGGYETLLGQRQPKIRTKHTKATIATRDQQTVVISGLMSKSKSSTENKWPILGDIPILGWFFKNRESTEQKKNLLLVLTPYIVRSDEDFQRIYDRKMRERETLAKMYFGDKISTYDPYIDYSKKRGPMTRLVDQVDAELQRAENGGPGLPGETVIRAHGEDSGVKKPEDSDVSSSSDNSATESQITGEQKEVSDISGMKDASKQQANSDQGLMQAQAY